MVLRDLGYVSIFVLESIEKAGAFYLNRASTSLNMYLKGLDETYNQLDYMSIIKHLEKTNSNVCDYEVYLGAKKDFKSRLILEFLPDKVYRERLRKAVEQRTALDKKNEKENAKRRIANVQLKKQGKVLKKLKPIHGLLSKEEKSKLRFNGYLTNINSQIVKQEQVRTIYRIRWQVELIFKAWKQNGEIAKVKKTKIERFETFLFAKMLYLLCNWFLFWEVSKQVWQEKNILLSVLKAYNRLKSVTTNYKNAIKQAMKGESQDLNPT